MGIANKVASGKLTAGLAALPITLTTSCPQLNIDKLVFYNLHATQLLYINLNGATATATYTDHIVLSGTTGTSHTRILEFVRPYKGTVSVIASGAATDLQWEAYFSAA